MIEIESLGPYSWEASCDVLGHFQPMTQHWRGSSDVVPMSFPLDGDFTPVAVALRWERGALRGEVVGTADGERVRRQVARILSLDHDGRDYPAVGERDPRVGRLM